MTTTTLYSGHDGKSSSRVLRPPGGGSSNIFGTEEPAPQQQQRQQQKEHFPAEPAPGSGASPGQPAPAQSQNQQSKQRAEAPFASFAESGKMSDPTQFDKCGTESQNEADFRCYSVTAYREAAATNAAVKQRARGQATGAFNPITHEEKSEISPFQAYEQGRVHPQQMAQQAPRPNRRPVGPPERAVQYNPITGEEYPADYGQKRQGYQQ